MIFTNAVCMYHISKGRTALRRARGRGHNKVVGGEWLDEAHGGIHGPGLEEAGAQALGGPGVAAPLGGRR